MRTATIIIMLAAAMVLSTARCSKGDRCCDRYDSDYRYRVLWDGDCRYGWYAQRYREFFEPNDFGRGHDSLYGNPRNRPDGDYSGFDDRNCCGHRQWHHSRGWGHRHDYGEDAVSERYAPRMTPETEYDE